MKDIRQASVLVRGNFPSYTKFLRPDHSDEEEHKFYTFLWEMSRKHGSLSGENLWGFIEYRDGSVINLKDFFYYENEKTFRGEI